MTKTMTTLITAALCLGAGSVAAKDYNPPAPDNVCSAEIAQYLVKTKAPQKSVIQILSMVERNGVELSFNFYGDLAAKMEGSGINVADVPYKQGTKAELTQYHDWGKANGMWLVVTPGKTAHFKAQVYASNGSRCLPAYPKPMDFDGGGMPEGLFSS